MHTRSQGLCASGEGYFCFTNTDYYLRYSTKGGSDGLGAGGAPPLLEFMSGRRLPPSNCTNKGIASTRTDAVR